MKLVVLAAAAGLMASAAPALAQTKAPESAPAAVSADIAASPSPRTLELARRYVKAAHMDEILDRLPSDMGAPIFDQMAKTDPKLAKSMTPEVKAAMVAVLADWFSEVRPKMMDHMIELTAATFSEEELTDLVTFYESPGGQAVMRKMPVMMSHMGDVMRDIPAPTTQDMVGRLCRKIDCLKAFGEQPSLKNTDSSRKS